MKTNLVASLMSGGIDSSMSTFLLSQRKDLRTVAFFLKFWSEDQRGISNKCCSLESERRARKIAQILKIPFFVLDLRKEFKKRIVDDFLFYLKKGYTPNPCVVCNQQIKFGLALEYFLKNGFHFVSSGHYAKIIKRKKNKKTFFELHEAKDKKKDQSYFLYRLKKEQLERIIFPLANYTRSKIEKMAEEIFPGFFSGIKKSVDVCFVKDNIFSFLKRSLGEKKGKIFDQKSNFLGYHNGFWFYTIGQRTGLNLPGGPYFVLKKDPKKNILIVTKDKKDLIFKKIFLEKVNLLENIKFPLFIFVKTRYRQKKRRAKLYFENKRYFLIFEKGVLSPTPGQSAVFYLKDKILGGGIISKIC